MNEIITERPNLFEPNVYITVCVEIAGTICPNKLTTAIIEAYKANQDTRLKKFSRAYFLFYKNIFRKIF